MNKDDSSILLIKTCYQELQRDFLDYKRQANDYYWQFFLFLLKSLGISKQKLFSGRSSMTVEEIELVLKQYILMERTNNFKLLKVLNKELNIRLKNQHQLLWKKTEEELGPPLSNNWSDFLFQAMWAATSISQNATGSGLAEEQLVVLLLNVKLYMFIFEHMRTMAHVMEDKFDLLINLMPLLISKEKVQHKLHLHQERLKSVINLPVTALTHGCCTHVLPLENTFVESPELSP